MTGPNPLDDWRTATRYRWTRPDGSLDVAEMRRQMDADYAARFGTGPARAVPATSRIPWETSPAQEMSGPGAASTAPAQDESLNRRPPT